MPTQKQTPAKKVEKEAPAEETIKLEELKVVLESEPATAVVPAEKSEMEVMKERLAQLEKTNAMLLEVADNKALAFYYDKHKEQLPTDICVRSFDGRVALAWKSIIDVIENNLITGSATARQEVMVFFQDGETQQMNLLSFEKRYVPIKCRLLSILSSEVDNTISYKLKRYDNGEELEVGAQFVN